MIPTKQQIHQAVRRAGFNIVACVANTAPTSAARFRQWIAQGDHAEMDWIENSAEKRLHPEVYYPEIKTIVVLGINYAPQPLSEHLLTDPSRGIIARYALGTDYHRVLKKQCQRIIQDLDLTASVRYSTDTAPLLERGISQDAGLGFIGRNTNLIHYQWGSYIFLAEILLPFELEPDMFRAVGQCGLCHNCIDTCPTKAIRADGYVDARRCIAYLTIEHRGSIPVDLRPLIKNRIFGCDICQEVCPWNRKAKPASLPAFQPRQEWIAPKLTELAHWTKENFMTATRQSAIRRATYEGFLRNVAVALGNWGSKDALSAIEHLSQHQHPLIAEHARWAKEQIMI